MQSLEDCLSSDPHDLQDYASHKVFAGENILFLTSIISFRKHWLRIMHSTEPTSEACKIMYNEGLDIFIKFVYTDTADECNVNLEGSIYFRLHGIFSDDAQLKATLTCPSAATRAPTYDVCPFAGIDPGDVSPQKQHNSGSCRRIFGQLYKIFGPNAAHKSGADRISLRRLWGSRPSTRGTDGSSAEHNDAAPDSSRQDVLLDVEAPAGFDNHIFDAAFNSIKYMVWTGLWQQYNKAIAPSQASVAVGNP